MTIPLLGSDLDCDGIIAEQKIANTIMEGVGIFCKEIELLEAALR